MFCTCYRLLVSCVWVRNKEFELYDRDQDGRLSLNEFHEACVTKYGRPPSTEEWMKFHLVDRNNNGYVTKAEIEWFENHNSFF